MSNESDLLKSLFCPEQPERIAHSPSLVKSDKSDSLTVALLSWATWANRSWLLFNLIDFEQKSEWAKEQIPNPGVCKVRIK